MLDFRATDFSRASFSCRDLSAKRIARMRTRTTWMRCRAYTENCARKVYEKKKNTADIGKGFYISHGYLLIRLKARPRVYLYNIFRTCYSSLRTIYFSFNMLSGKKQSVRVAGDFNHAILSIRVFRA